MASNPLVTPPIRTALINNPDGSPLNQSGQANGSDSNGGPLSTEKTWYYYWRDAGLQINRNTTKLNGLVQVGLHKDRPPAANMPEGAIYVEFDRGAIYQNWTGAWQYLAGIMYGTLSPDQRPTDLGGHDGGFTFRTNVAPPREFIWSQTQWVESTPVTVGTHADRPATTTESEGNLYVEFDRGGVIYQNWVGGWQYLAGTMWGTISPDQRPTDLGVKDAGFDFRGTDQQREFIWSQTAWIEVTPQWTPVAGGIAYMGGGVGIGTANIYFPLGVITQPDHLLGISPAILVADSICLDVVNATNSANKPLEIRATFTDFSLGNVGIGMTTSPAYQLQLTADSAAKPGSSTWIIASDARLKRNVQPLAGGLDVIERLRLYEAEYNGLGNMPIGMRVVGFLAQELREVLSHAVTSHKGKLNAADADETDILHSNIHEVLMHLVLAVQQLSAEIKALKQKP